MCRVLALAPANLVDLFFNLQTLQIVKLRFMGLELRVKLVLASLFLIAMRFQRRKIAQKAGLVERGRKEMLTPSFLSNSTTRPPLSPVAK
jgi:hypothetical protein